MSARYALGAVAAMAGLAALGHRGSRSERWAYHATRERPLRGIATSGLEPRPPFGFPGNPPAVVYFAVSRDLAAAWGPVIIRFPWPRSWDSDPWKVVEIDGVMVPWSSWTPDRIPPDVIEVERDGHWVPLIPPRGSRATLLQQLPPGFLGVHEQDAEDNGLDLIVRLHPALRAAVEVIEDMYGVKWKDIVGPFAPRRLIEEVGLRATDRVVVISFIEVPAIHRGMGLGTEGVERIERWAATQGAAGILVRAGQVDYRSASHPTGFWRAVGYYEVHLHGDPVESFDDDAILFKGAGRFSPR